MLITTKLVFSSGVLISWPAGYLWPAAPQLAAHQFISQVSVNVLPCGEDQGRRLPDRYRVQSVNF